MPEQQFSNIKISSNHSESTLLVIPTDLALAIKSALTYFILTLEELHLVAAGNRVQAIKLHRSRTEMSLRDSKSIIDMYFDLIKTKGYQIVLDEIATNWGFLDE